MPKLYGNYLSFLLFLLIFPQLIRAQSSFELKVEAADGYDEVLGRYRIASKPADSLQTLTLLRELISSLHNDGYLLARLESLQWHEENARVNAAIEVGQRFEWLSLKTGNLDKTLMRRAGFKAGFFDGKPFKYRQVARLQDKLVSHAERNGHPFARATIDSLYIENNQIGGVLNFDPGPPIVFDSIRVSSDFRIKSSFLASHLGIQMGSLYDQQQLDRLGNSLAGLPYLRVNKAPRVTFQNSEATLYLNLVRRRVNQIDGIIGFLPDANNDGSLLVTGQFDVVLYNPFASGKKIGLHWRRQNVESQSLNLEYEHPNLFGSQISAGVDFDFLKQDTTFTRRDLKLEFSYKLAGNGYFTVFTHQQGTNRISTAGLDQLTRLPEVIDFDLAAYGLGFRWNSFDDFFLPRRGLGLNISASAGNKKLSPNAELPPELVTGLDTKNLQYEFGLSFEKHSPLGQRFVLFNKTRAGLLVNDRLFRNDAMRLGGLNSLRGFNENFFFATEYVVATMEGRFFFDRLSYFSLFADGGVVHNGFSEEPVTDYPLGLGAGISFSTDAGIFNFVYALGRSDQSGPLAVSQSKIHFGFTSRF